MLNTYLLFILLALLQQAPAGTASYIVTYIEVAPSSKAAATAALKQYRDASRKEEGAIRIELFEQVGRPGYFSLIEAWTDPKAAEAHRAAEHAKELDTKLQPLRLSEVDQRPYKALSVSSVTAANARDSYVITHVDVGGQSDAPNLLRRVAEASRKESGNSRHDVLQHAVRANHFTVIESWQNPKALETHREAAHTKQYREALQPLLGSPLDERWFEVLE